MSKTGENLRNYGRMYPGLVNNTTIIYFMPWPPEALVEVANASLKNFDFDEDLRKNIALYFGNAHTKVIELADKMWKELKRLYYVTPTNYIELVKGYSELLNMKREEIGNEINKLGGGLDKLN
jgi:dynein heavy chain